LSKNSDHPGVTTLMVTNIGAEWTGPEGNPPEPSAAESSGMHGSGPESKPTEPTTGVTALVGATQPTAPQGKGQERSPAQWIGMQRSGEQTNGAHDWCDIPRGRNARRTDPSAGERTATGRGAADCSGLESKPTEPTTGVTALVGATQFTAPQGKGPERSPAQWSGMQRSEPESKPTEPTTGVTTLVGAKE